MSHVVVIGCGVVGAAIAYELSQLPLKVTVLDRQPPAKGATGAALGVLMGVISHKVKGKAWQMRSCSIQRYETLIPELEALTGHQIPFNRQGILKLLVPLQDRNPEEDLTAWEQLVAIRRSQGWHLEIWDSAQVRSRCSHLVCDAALYSPQDRQVDPVALTLAMIDAAQRSSGVTFHFGVTVEDYHLTATSSGQHLRSIEIKSLVKDCGATLVQDIDWLVVAAGLGSVQCLQLMKAGLDALPNQPQPNTEFKQVLDIRPVLGQAIHLRLSHPLGNPNFQPAITGNDVHIVPVAEREYWVGATVEFPRDTGEPIADAACLEAVMDKAISFCPSLAAASIVRTWSGLRPRPEGRPAPIIGHLPGYSNVLLATGHYRNGVLLAPATAQAIREIIIS